MGTPDPATRSHSGVYRQTLDGDTQREEESAAQEAVEISTPPPEQNEENEMLEDEETSETEDSGTWSNTYPRLVNLCTQIIRIRKMKRIYERALARVTAAFERELRQL